MENKIRINLDNNLELVAELYDHDGNHPEITVYIEKDGMIYQDICLVRPHEGPKCMQENDSFDCLVWADKNNEDFTDKYHIAIYKEN
jgi:hypothetical protein